MRDLFSFEFENSSCDIRFLVLINGGVWVRCSIVLVLILEPNTLHLIGSIVMIFKEVKYTYAICSTEVAEYVEKPRIFDTRTKLYV